MIFLSTDLLAQLIYVGDIETREAIPGALIVQNGHSLGSTDLDGRLEINTADSSALIFLHTGFQKDTLTWKELHLMNYRVFLIPKDYLIAPVVVSASRFGDSTKTVPFHIQSINTKTLRAATTQNSADLLQDQGQVYVQKSQMGGGSPVLRGFEANRVLLVTDGVRMNNAIYRSGHLQNILTVDAEAQQSVEVLFGPSSVIYGSDALGGVVHFHSLKGVYGHDSTRVVHGSAMVKYNSANAGTNFHVHTLVGLKNVALVTSLSSASFSHLRAGRRANPFKTYYWKQDDYVAVINGKDTVITNPDPFLQVGTSYAQRDFMQKVSFYGGEFSKHTFLVNYSVSSNIPRYDRLILREANDSPKFAKWEYGPQKRLFAYYKGQSWKKSKVADEVNFTASYQLVEESRINRDFQDVWEANRIEKVSVIGLSLDARKGVGTKSTLQYGTEVYFDDVKSLAFEQNTLTNDQRDIATRYPDGGATRSSLGVYSKYLWQPKKQWDVRIGVRYNLIGLKAAIDDTTFYTFPIDEVKTVNQALSGTFGTAWHPLRWMSFKGALSSGFRAPNVDDISKVFDSTPGNVVVPNPELKPEKAYTAEISAVVHDDKQISIEVGAYYTAIKDLIQVGDFMFNGLDSIEYDGELSRVQANINVPNAQIYGGYLLINYKPFRFLESSLTITKTKGEDISQGTPLAHIPPLYGKWALVHSISKRNLKHQLFIQFNGWKYAEDFHPTGTDRLLYATPEGSPAWYTLNYLVDKRLGEHVALRFGVNNIFDTHYRAFSSAVTGAGRHVIINLRADF